MIPLPDWAPNVHPLIVHFPIALLFAAAFTDGAGLLFTKQKWLQSTAVGLYVSGAIFVLLAYFTGQSAGDSVFVPLSAQSVMNEHADWAFRTVWFYAVVAVSRTAILWFVNKRAKSFSAWMHRLAVISCAAGLFLVVSTGELGARMVFGYGVGVKTASDIEQREQANRANSTTPTTNREHKVEDDVNEGTNTAFPIAENGSWLWTPGLGVSEMLNASSRFLEGDLDDLGIIPMDSLLVLSLDKGPVTFVLGNSVEDLEAGILMQIDQFNGSVQLIHHVQNIQQYDFLSLKDGVMRLGRKQPGSTDIFSEETVDYSGWIPLRVLSIGRHFRGFIGKDLRVHGHGDQPGRGPIGLRLEGTGTVLIKNMYLESAQ